jgi:GMC oxidoreductase
LLDYARREGGTYYHASCTCMIGSHAMAVVDDEAKVHGLDGLRVIDASVMPAVTSTNTTAQTIMIERRGDNQRRRAAKASGVAKANLQFASRCRQTGYSGRANFLPAEASAPHSIASAMSSNSAAHKRSWTLSSGSTG